MSLPAPPDNLQKVSNCTRDNGTERILSGVGFGWTGRWTAADAPGERAPAAHPVGGQPDPVPVGRRAYGACPDALPGVVPAELWFSCGAGSPCA
jgi:hypothetical protein